MSIIDKFIGKLAPHDCLGCGQESNLICPKCLAALPGPIVPPIEATYLTDIRAATLYRGIAKQLVWKLKYAHAQAAAEIMAHKMVPLLNTDHTVLVSVPTATSRVRQRGFDQARLLARQLARQAKLPWMDGLSRMGQIHQVGANREQRRHQLHKAFRVMQLRFVKGAHITLIDDVITTGSTLEAAAQTLKAAGATKVEAITFAYTKQ